MTIDRTDPKLLPTARERIVAFLDQWHGGQYGDDPISTIGRTSGDYTLTAPDLRELVAARPSTTELPTVWLPEVGRHEAHYLNDARGRQVRIVHGRERVTLSFSDDGSRAFDPAEARKLALELIARADDIEARS